MRPTSFSKISNTGGKTPESLDSPFKCNALHGIFSRRLRTLAILYGLHRIVQLSRFNKYKLRFGSWLKKPRGVSFPLWEIEEAVIDSLYLMWTIWYGRLPFKFNLSRLGKPSKMQVDRNTGLFARHLNSISVVKQTSSHDGLGWPFGLLRWVYEQFPVTSLQQRELGHR